MATLVSPGVSVSIVDDSFFVPATAATRPLFFIATRADKTQLDGVTPAPYSREHSVVRTITSLQQSVEAYGIPYFRKDIANNQLHGDARNEYGLFALNQFLTVGSAAYVVRANIDLSDTPVTTLTAGSPQFSGVGNGSMTGFTVNQSTGHAELWTFTCTGPSSFTVAGFVSGAQGSLTVGTPYNNGIISCTITAGGTPFVAGDVFQVNITQTTTSAPLGSTDAVKRVSIVTALKAEINSNTDVRSELYQYNLILCPGYPETVDALLNLNQAINEEAFIIADTPFNLKPEDTATWAQTIARYHSEHVAYYYPHAVASNLDGEDVFVAASGVALKTYAYSDAVSEVWFAPAGLRRGIVTGVTSCGYVTGTLGTATTYVQAPLNQGQRDVLYQYFTNINIIPFLPGRGIVVFGQKTSYSSASALDRVNVSRMIIKIKRDLRINLMAYLFELNDEQTRASVKTMVDDYLHDIMVRRGLYDYLVVCSEDNNTPERIDRNELYCDIYLKPAKSIEFIHTTIKIQSTGATLGQ